MLPILYQHGRNLNEQDCILKETPLHKALFCKMWNNVNFLISQTIRPKLQDFVGDTVLHRAASVSSTPVTVLQSLLRIGADVSITNDMGDTALQKAKMIRNNTAVSIIGNYSY